MEALSELEGRAADWALEDLSESVLGPAIAAKFGLLGQLDVSQVQIDNAIFTGLKLAFVVRVSMPLRSFPNAIDSTVESIEQKLVVLRGSIDTELLIELTEVSS
jgi:hypothetical protein